MRKVSREEFVLVEYRDYAYWEVPLPLLGDGKNQTISCPHSYPLFYEALKLSEGDRFLEIGAGSGYGAALAREVVGDRGLVVTIEINPTTYKFALDNLRRLGYDDIIVVLGDGSEGYPSLSPYDKICVTATAPNIPGPLVDQLGDGGKLAIPVGSPYEPQVLYLVEKARNRISKRVIDEALYVPLVGKYGWRTFCTR